jgi:hypothetical protein
MEKNTAKIDLDFYEKVVIYNCLLDNGYLGSIIDYLKEDIFNDKDIKSVIGIIKDFYIKEFRGHKYNLPKESYYEYLYGKDYMIPFKKKSKFSIL